MLDQLELYVNAQKTIANYMLALGLMMIVGAVFIHFTTTHSLFYGLKTGLLVFGLISAASGYGYQLTEEKLLKTQTLLYQENATEFHQKEKERMTKVVKNFPVIQIAFVAIILIALVINLLLHKAFVNGLLFALVIFLVGNMIIESVSKTSIDAYYHKLIQS